MKTSNSEIIIIGAGGFAYECWLMLRKLLDMGAPAKFAGFAAKEASSILSYGLGDLFLGDEDGVEIRPEREFIIAVGSPHARKAIHGRFKARGARFMNLADPSAIVNEEILEHTEASIFCPNSITVSLKFGIGNVVNSLSTVAHDTRVGDFNVFSGHCDICGHAKIGDLNFFGSRASMLPSAKLGNGNRVAAGSVVYKKHRDGRILLGNPAQDVGCVL